MGRILRRLAKGAHRVEGGRERHHTHTADGQRGRFERSRSGIGRRAIDRARRLRAQRQRHRARGHGRPRSGGRSARRARQIPGIAGGWGGGEIGVFGGVHLAQDHRTRRAQMGHHGGIGAGRRKPGARRAEGARRQATHVDHILHRDGNAVQRAALHRFRIQDARLGQSILSEHVNPGLHRAIDLRDAIQAALHQRLGGQRTAGDGGAEVANASRILNVAHARSSLRRVVVAAMSAARLSCSIPPVKITP